MKKLVILILLNLATHFNLIAQVKNINDIKSLEALQNNMKKKTESVIVWGSFIGWGKYSDIHKFYCKEELDMNTFSKITSCLDFKLFGDSSTYYLPIKYESKIHADYKDGDIIKMKVRLYRDCKVVEG